MSEDDLIDDLVEEILDTGRTPEDVCTARPELLEAVQQRLAKLRAVQAQVDWLFPPTEGGANALLQSLGENDVTLPEIPGYEMLAVLGRGGMGIVYKARHLRLNRIVALKMLLTGSYASKQEQLRFVREAESVAALKHASIIQIYEFGEVDGHAFYTMEYVGGGSLAEKLASGVLPARESAEITSGLARAVQAAHAAGIVHRDLKPANVLLGEAGAPKIADFGLARRFDQDSGLTHTGARIGTPSYMAPEQMLGSSSALGPPVDVFAVGAILYELLTGRPPFRGDSLSDTERKLATQDPTPPSRLNTKVPRDLETICLRCLEKDPRNRYASAGELAADLERFLRHEPILARPIAPAERAIRWIRRNPLPTALAAAAVVLVLLIGTQVLEEWSQAVASRAENARLTARLQSGIQLIQSGRFAEAQALLGQLGDGGFEDLRKRIDQALSDLKLVEQLDRIGIKRAMALSEPDSNWTPNIKASQEYAAVFAESGIARPGEAVTNTVKQIGSSDIREPLIAALDDWAVCETDKSRRRWILEVARLADSEAHAWEHQLRDPATWQEHEQLTVLADHALAEKLLVQQLRAIGDRLETAGLDATAFRRRVEEQHVDSFLANLALADDLRTTDPAEAIRYYQAALAIRPQSATAHNNLAVALAKLGRVDEAILQFEQAIRFDDESAASEFNLACELTERDPPRAIKHFERACTLNARLAVAHRALGKLLLEQGQYQAAAAAFARCQPLFQDESARSEIAELLKRCAEHESQKGD